MFAKRFSAGLCLSAALALAPAAAETPPLVGDEGARIEFAQGFKETPLEDLPAVDKDRGQPPARTTGLPKPPPVPPTPRVTTRTPPPADDESGPPAREVPPPPRALPPARSATAPPPPRMDDPPLRRAEPPPRAEEPPARRADTTRRPPARPVERSSFYANCTQQCHLSCEASFEACNGDSSPAKPACVKKLESCRIERCSCRFD